MDYQVLADKVISGENLSPGEALKVISSPDSDFYQLLAAADKIRKHFKGNKIKLCAIVNAKSGRCGENCIFCAQSAHYSTNCQTYPLLSEDKLFEAARNAQNHLSATCFSIVTSGKSIYSEQELTTITNTVKKISSQTKLNRCVSIGTIKKEQIIKLKQAGLKRFHHNLETAESFFPNICTTHTFQERLATVKAAKEVGLEVCSGGIFGLGESLEQRIELAFTLKELDVDSIPINILNPIPGTPAAQNYQPLIPFEVLRIVAAFRFILPNKDIGVLGGREISLRSLQPLLFAAGANFILIGDYLTTQGQPPEKDLEMIRDLGLEIENV